MERDVTFNESEPYRHVTKLFSRAENQGRQGVVDVCMLYNCNKLNDNYIVACSN